MKAIRLFRLFLILPFHVLLTHYSFAACDTIVLKVTKAVSDIAVLSWNPVVSNVSSGYYKIYREYPAGTWTLLDSVTVTNYSDKITICGDTLKYRIEIEDISGCTSVSNIDGNFFKDVTTPVAPMIDSVSLNAGGNVIIGWNRNPSNDTYAYVILHYIAGSWIPIDTVYGINNTFYTSTVNATTSTEQFRIFAIDSCNNPSYPSIEHQTLLLKGATITCQPSINLSWNAYINASSVPLYTIYMNTNGGPFVPAGTVTGTAFTVKNLKADSIYCFFIQARFGLNASSSSTLFCFTPALPSGGQYAYIRHINVDSPEAVQVIGYVDTVASIKQYRLMRAASSTGNFSVVATVANNRSTLISLVDNTVRDADKIVFYYKIISVDSCGNSSTSSQVSHTIVPFAAANDNFTNTVTWNDYGQWPAGVSEYLVYRRVEQETGMNFVSRLNGLLYIDNLPDSLVSTSGHFCYRIYAVEAPGNPYGFSDTSYSAWACTMQQSFLYIANAFTPGGFNPIFKPVFAYVPADGYSFKIFNRWAQIVFETDNPTIGWDGTLNGRPCQEDVYAWILTAQFNDGGTVKKAGIVTLLR